MQMTEQKFFTPKEAAEYLSEKSGREINVNRLGQLRRAGKVKAIRLAYNETLYTQEQLDQADTSLGTPGRKPKTDPQNT